MKKVGAWQADNVLIWLLDQFIFIIFRLLVLELADAALVMLRFLISEQKLEFREESEGNVSVDSFISSLLLLHIEGEQVADFFVEGIVLSDPIGLVQLDCVHSCPKG